MCGILGFIGEDLPSKIKIENSLNKIAHRGPDNIEYKIIDDNCFLGHTRLSIIDLETRSNQPFNIDDYYISFNGEIFNFQDLKNQLEIIGYTFKTKSDTEVLLYSYIHWGEKCVEKLNGMWAFCIYHKISKKAFLSRDRFGIKPLRYHLKNNSLYFSSEAKAIFPLLEYDIKPNIEKIVNFIKESEGCFSTNTWFKDIYNLLPGYNATFCNGEFRTYQYFEGPSKSIIESQSKFFFNNLENTIKLRLMSDVPLGYTMSSGLDSTSIVRLANLFDRNGAINTYTAAFDSKESEHDLAEKFALQYKLKNKVVNNKFSNSDVINKLVYHLESGHGSPAIFPLFSLYDEINKDGIKVVLEGQGADELLGGYVSSNYIAFLISKFKKGKLKDLLKIFKSKKDFSIYEALSKYLRAVLSPMLRDFIFFLTNWNFIKLKYLFTKREKRLYKTSNNYFSNYLNRQHSETLTNLLHYGDAISMAYSIENRVPFLDIDFVNYCSNLSDDYKMGIYNKKFVGKLIHRKEMEEILPDYILFNKKKGFPTPVDQILNSDWAKFYINDLKYLKKYKVLKSSSIFKIENNKSKLSNNLLYRVLITEVWFQKFFN